MSLRDKCNNLNNKILGLIKILYKFTQIILKIYLNNLT